MAPFTLIRATCSASTVDAGDSNTRMAKIHRWQFIASAPYHAACRLDSFASRVPAARTRLGLVTNLAACLCYRVLQVLQCVIKFLSSLVISRGLLVLGQPV